MATWCIATGQSPEVWKQSTRLERAAWLTVLERLAESDGG